MKGAEERVQKKVGARYLTNRDSFKWQPKILEGSAGRVRQG